MKKSIFLLLLLASASFAMSQAEKEPYLTKSLSTESIKNVEATTSGGSILVKGISASDARLEVYLTPNNYNSDEKQPTREELKQRLDELYNLTIKVEGGKLTVSAKSKEQIKDWKKALSISYKIYVPQSASTDLSTSGGSISLADLSGSQKFSTSGGSLHIEKLSGKINGRTSGGSIHVQDSKDEIDLSTSGGSITASNCSGNLKLRTSGGSLNLSDLKGTTDAVTSGGSVRGKSIEGELKTHTSGGSISLDHLSCSLETSTSGGRIDVSFTQLGKYIKISNSAGDINLSLPDKGVDLDLTGRIANTHFNNFNGKIDETMVKGKLNGGGIPVTVSTSSGRIKLDLK